MGLHQWHILFCLLCLLCIFAVDARRLKKYQRYKAPNNIERSVPLLRQANTEISTENGTNDDDIAASTGTGTGTDMGPNTAPENNVSPNPADALVLINPTKADSTPRLLKGFLFHALMGSANKGGQSSVPYIIVNVPNNITNINQNNLNNSRPVPITAPITTPITTPITSPITVPAGTRRRVYYEPAPIPQNPQVYHQRRSKPKAEEDYAQNFIRSPSNQLLPVFLPPEIQNLMTNRNVVRRRGGQRKRVQNQKQNLNLFAAFADSLRRIQYL
ncbi:uncharacterized protein [Eurosta solidaginis]|uniref:uncharacterized protein n=1 Tax=Eurosta solidaginis TaxID=178769 RepID=UPI00353097E0